ncbi:MAG: hypothetical protein IAF94_05085 [Pirellulaceae bacterium]|nr:hypothetical protein [Pirellulaceae bacterium]
MWLSFLFLFAITKQGFSLYQPDCLVAKRAILMLSLSRLKNIDSGAQSMPRKLNPDYFRRIMQGNELRGLAAVFLTGEQFGVKTQHPQEHEYETIYKTRNQTIAIDANYQGWTAPGKLYCVQCWNPLVGIPREIIAANWCKTCQQPLYDISRDDDRFDYFGNYIYRDRVTRLTAIAVRQYRNLISGAESIGPSGSMKTGSQKDHIFSVRDGFELDIDEAVIASPINVRVIPKSRNLQKNRKSEITQDELRRRYADFLAVNPVWIEQAKISDDQQRTFTKADFPLLLGSKDSRGSANITVTMRFK